MLTKYLDLFVTHKAKGPINMIFAIRAGVSHALAYLRMQIS